MKKTELKAQFEKCFLRPCTDLFSAPGRTELGGNHTDHQHGKVLAAAVDLSSEASCAVRTDGIIRVFSAGFPPVELSLNDLQAKEAEKHTSAALVRGIAAAFEKRGVTPCGFDAFVTSEVACGSGLSSSAAFEVLIGTILNFYTGSRLSPLEIAKAGREAENLHFGKPCGLMDQTACALGGILFIDFENAEEPAIRRLDPGVFGSGHSLYIIGSGADHSNLTDDYASIPEDLSGICAFFGKQYLREVPEEAFFQNFAALKKSCGDRAMLRAVHVYDENRRVDRELEALETGNFDTYLKLVRESGDSSWKYLQNVIPPQDPKHQEMALTLAVIRRLLNGRGAARVHGGGFAGAVQAYVPKDMEEEFKEKLSGLIGKEKITRVSLRKEGGIRLG